jgi:hemoglobin
MRKGKRAVVLAWIALGLVTACTKHDVPATPVNAADTLLYRRLGGYDGIASVTDSFLARIKADTAINTYFAKLDPVQINRVRQNVVDQLCAASGGPCLYVGKSMRDAHASLRITRDVFDRFVADFEATMTSLNVKDREKTDVLAALRSMRGDVVTK